MSAPSGQDLIDPALWRATADALEPGKRCRGRCLRCYQTAQTRAYWPCAVCGRTTRPDDGRCSGKCGTCYQREYRRAYRAAGGR